MIHLEHRCDSPNTLSHGRHVHSGKTHVSNQLPIVVLRRVAGWVLLTAVVLTPLTATHSPAVAQLSASPVEEHQSKQRELNDLNGTLSEVLSRQKRLAGEIEGLSQDIAAINRALIETAKRSKSLEDGITQAELRLEEEQRNEAQVVKSLSGRRALLAEVLAALQRMGRNPPPAILVSPQDALKAVRSALVLGAVVPNIRQETDKLLADLETLSIVRLAIAQQKEGLTKALSQLSEDEARLTLLVDKKKDVSNQSEQALAGENLKAAQLAAKAGSLKELIENLENQMKAAAIAADAARTADERRAARETERLAEARQLLRSGNVPKPASAPSAEVFENTARSEPAIAFAKAKGLLPRPVSGKQIYAFGSRGQLQARNKNIALATRVNARVSSPADGWIVYAGPFRSYGKLLILNPGDNYYVVLSGMRDINVSQGQFVLRGEPIGRMGAVQVASAAPQSLGSNRPVLYVEFRKDGKSIDPAPWWMVSEIKGPDNDS